MRLDFLHYFSQNKMLNAEMHMRIQLSSIKPDIKEICKNVKESHPSQKTFFPENN